MSDLIKTKTRGKRSWCWQHFSSQDDETVTCDICSAKIKYYSSTSTMIYHLAARHKIFNIESKRRKLIEEYGSENDSTDESFTSSSTSSLSSLENNCPKKDSKITNRIIRFIVGTNQPLSMINNQFFVEMVNELRTNYKVPGSRKLESQLIPQMSNDVKQIIRHRLAKATKVSLTMDCWSSACTDSYLGVTVHFVGENMERFNYALAMRYLEESHSGSYLFNELVSVCTEWNIVDKVLTIVTDSAANMINAINRFDNIIPLSCFGHKLNLAVNDVFKLKSFNDEPDDIISAVILKCKKLVGSFKKSALLTTRLKQKQNDLNSQHKIKLVQDVSTRWHSTLDMLNSILINQDPLTSMVLEQINKAIKPNFPSESEFIVIKDLVNLLTPIKELTIAISGKEYVTSSLLFPLSYFLVREEIPNVQTDHVESGIFKDQLIRSLTNRLDYLLSDENDLFLACTLLDPRFKSFEFITDDDDRIILIQRAKKFLVSYYKKNIQNENFLDESQHADVVIETVGQNTQNSSGSNINNNSVGGSGASFNSNRFKFGSRLDMDKNNLVKKVRNKCSKMSNQILLSSEAKLNYEIDMFISDNNLEIEDPLAFFSTYRNKFPIITSIAIQLMSIPATSVPSEQLFSHAGLVDTCLRNRLKPSTVEELTLLKENMNN